MSCQHPNIVYILADDLGYGDLSCFNEHGSLHTVNLDRMASGGVRFLNAHANSAVCTPTRYGVLTGRYCWRSWLKSGVVGGYTRALLDSQRTTVASFLRQHGYHTACFGKWHLGMDWVRTGDRDWDVDFSQPVKNGPVDLGFAQFFGISASLDMPPYAYIENDRVTEIPDAISRCVDSKGFWREGATSPDFRHVEVLPNLTRRACEYIRQRAGQTTPFFCYVPLPAPHTPILPTEQFIGTSNTNFYGDFVLQMDWTVGRILAALEETGQADNTLVVFTSDNGCSPMADFAELAKAGHNPSYCFRGHKADIFEGGHRVPFIARWPERIRPGSTRRQVICLTDLLATCADIVGESVPEGAGEDSFSILPAMSGAAGDDPVRPATVLHSMNGSFGIRRENWKLEMCPGSGGWSHPRPNSDEIGGLPPVQLYDLDNDPGETCNLQAHHPALVAELRETLTRLILNGRSTPGGVLRNDGTEYWEQLSWIRQC